MQTYLEAWRAARALREQTHPDDVNGGTFTWEGNPGTVYSTASPGAHIKIYSEYQQNIKPIKAYWLREEIPVADELMALAPKLRDEFLAYHTEFFDLSVPTKLKPYRNKDADVTTSMSGLEAWLTEGVKYTWEEKQHYSNRHLEFGGLVQRYFPTACSLTRKYGSDCPISAYSCIEPGESILRHTGVENRDNEYLRIHIPLIIPEGDVFFECEGVEIDWEDLWAFDNQLIHSAHNFSQGRRLIYMIDLSRRLLGLPPGEKYDPRREQTARPFVRGLYPKVLHKKQQGLE
jgi:hypothetical protein